MPETLELYLWRFAPKDKYTVGRLYADGELICNTIEDPDYGFDGSTPVSIIKQTKQEHPKQVAIPYGRYEVSTKWARGFANTHPWYKSQPLGSHIPCLVDVPAYSGILIHCGVSADSSAGCIIVGYNTIKGKVTDSKKAYTEIATLIKEANDKGIKTYITISQCPL